MPRTRAIRPRGCLLPCPHELDPAHTLLLFVGVVALRPLARLLRRPVSGLRLMVEAFVTALAVIGLVWLGWIALWLLEQRC